MQLYSVFSAYDEIEWHSLKSESEDFDRCVWGLRIFRKQTCAKVSKEGVFDGKIDKAAAKSFL